MPVITIDNKKIEAVAGTTVLKAALDNGIFIPHFCWHPTLSVSGNCRMCVVEIVGRPKLEVSCNLPVAEGMVIRTDSEAVKKTRADVLEFLLTNHPLDCPICDQAGECLLQDYHFKYSGRSSRFKEEKTHRPKGVDVGPNIKLDNERCILCTRCVRFCAETAKAADLTVAIRGDRSFITTAPGRKLDNPYSMNTVDLCPVGALTSKDFRFKKRVWFLRSTPSICPNCSNGCPIWIDHENDKMYRWRPRGGFLCDEGRLSYKEWQSGKRIAAPLTKSEVGLVETNPVDAVADIRSVLGSTPKEKVVGVIESGASCEDVDAFLNVVGKAFMTGRKEDVEFEDGIIKKRDKNPNTKYLEGKGLKEIPKDLTGDVLVIAGGLSGDDILKVVGFEWKMIVQITHDMEHAVPGANVILPRATFVESSGTFVNFKGEVQNFSKACEPKGDCRTVKEWLSAF